MLLKYHNIVTPEESIDLPVLKNKQLLINENDSSDDLSGQIEQDVISVGSNISNIKPCSDGSNQVKS